MHVHACSEDTLTRCSLQYWPLGVRRLRVGSVHMEVLNLGRCSWQRAAWGQCSMLASLLGCIPMAEARAGNSVKVGQLLALHKNQLKNLKTQLVTSAVHALAGDEAASSQVGWGTRPDPLHNSQSSSQCSFGAQRLGEIGRD